MHGSMGLIRFALFLYTNQAEPVFKDPKRYPELADPKLKGDFPVRGLNQAVAVAAMCLNEESSVRPLISDVVTALSFLGTSPENAETALSPITIPSPQSNQGAATKGNIIILDDLDDDSVLDRQQAVAEAMEWGTSSRTNAQTGVETATTF
ncbi:hypothetical protein L6164_003269 [Bauhinia variegata]|uniref:Uncharacterized protein n=1 Tax=Bauhinia variegata TaxID=167791 RepID=A0ACB9Q1C9_BAUVA|nr:hypothetical protein L6164_003269 [Bauhinia variegata]